MSHLLIDGYNVLAASSYKSREDLLAQLRVYKKVHDHEITIFFDGTHQGTGHGDKYIEGNVEIIFSPLTVTADEMMEEYLDDRFTSNMIVVSSDRRIQKAAIAKKLPYLEAKEFLFKMKYIPTSGKRVALQTPWLEGRTTEEESPSRSASRKKGNPQKKSKKDRKKLNTLKKL
jgi:predicted RNA-binding protein with PIN domain